MLVSIELCGGAARGELIGEEASSCALLRREGVRATFEGVLLSVLLLLPAPVAEARDPRPERAAEGRRALRPPRGQRRRQDHCHEAHRRRRGPHARTGSSTATDQGWKNITKTPLVIVSYRYF